MFENNGHIHVHVYSTWAGADNVLKSELLYKHKPVVTLVICCKLLFTLYRYETKFDLDVIRSMSTQCYHSNKLRWAQVINATFQGQRPFDSGEEEFKGFYTIYRRSGHFGHVTQIPQSNFHSPDPCMFHM